MTKNQAISFAIKKIQQIIPLEEDDVKNLCENILSSSNGNSEKIAESFLNILGHEDLSFEFVIEFNSLLEGAEKINKDVNTVKVSNEVQQTEHIIRKSNNSAFKETTKNELVRIKKPIGKIVSESIKQKEVKKDQTKSSGSKKSKKAKAHSLQDINEVVKMLELERDNESNSCKYICDCQARRHPLFDAAPNCLSCGKIVCVREGLNLNSCSFCGTDLIPLQERLKIIELLKHQKEELLNKASLPNDEDSKYSGEKKKKNKSFKVSSGRGTNLFTEQDKLIHMLEKQNKEEKILQEKENEERATAAAAEEEEEKLKNKDSDLMSAQDRLNKLLHFQESSAERTRIIDNASDFSMSDEAGLWGSANERALILKKQQRNLRKWEKLERERHGKRDKYVVSMNIGINGKVTMSEVDRNEDKAPAYSDDDLDNISDEEDLNDLQNIKHLKDEIDQDKTLNSKKLISSTWDPEKYNSQFKKPVYIGDHCSAGTESDISEPEIKISRDETTAWKYRVQVNSSDAGDSLEQNILAVI